MALSADSIDFVCVCGFAYNPVQLFQVKKSTDDHSVKHSSLVSISHQDSCMILPHTEAVDFEEHSCDDSE